jgi:hypothetical protein
MAPRIAVQWLGTIALRTLENQGVCNPILSLSRPVTVSSLSHMVTAWLSSSDPPYMIGAHPIFYRASAIMALKNCARYWSRCDEWSAGTGSLHCFFGPLTRWAWRTPLSDQTGPGSDPSPQAARPAPFLGCLALTASVALILAASWPVPASAQTVPPANTAAQGLRRQEQRQKRAQSLLPQAPNQLHRGPAMPGSLARLPHESPCFVISAIRFTGAHAKRLAWLSH